MSLLLPIHKRFSDLIFSGEKDLEFRNRLIKITDGDTAYVYETKKGGCGMVVGSFICGKMTEIPMQKIGTYNFLKHYADKYCDEETKASVDLMMQAHFNTHYDCLALSYLFFDDFLKEIIKTGEPIDSFRMASVERYSEKRKKQTELLDACDKWLSRIGFYNEYDESTWNYYIPIKNAKRFNSPIPITEFCLLNGKRITKVPQSFCYCEKIYWEPEKI